MKYTKFVRNIFTFLLSRQEAIAVRALSGVLKGWKGNRLAANSQPNTPHAIICGHVALYTLCDHF